MADSSEVVIERVGAQGDGVALSSLGARYVPFALPGETWRLVGSEAALVTASAERRQPLCRHFGSCGGCIAQHMSSKLYETWKHESVVEAFRHRGLAAEVLPLVRVGAQSRRRAFLGVERHGKSVTIGFREEGQHKLVDLLECPVLDPMIVAAVASCREMARIAMRNGEGGRLVMTRLDHGLDVVFDNGRRDISPQELTRLADLAAEAKLIRLTVAGDLIVQRGRPTLTIADVEIEPPPSVFLQAVPEAERVLVEHVLAAIPKRAKKAADLFSGLGTLTLPLARRLAVSAFDSDKRAIGALSAGIKTAQGLKPVEARVRDLFREPLSARELDTFDVVVLDPPRAGAQAQAERIAKSKVPVVIAISCNPATLARDARLLIDGGYTMGPVIPVDQFIYSAHTEAATVFRR